MFSSRSRQTNYHQTNRSYYGIILLLAELGRSSHLPPITLVIIILNVLIYFDIFPLFGLSSDLQSVCVSTHTVLDQGDYMRILLAPFFHGDDMHLYYNMASFLYKGQQLETLFGSQYFALLLAILTLLSSLMLVLLGQLASSLLDNPEYLFTCAVGFSAVIFALKVITTHYTPAYGSNTFLGFIPISAKYIVWVELVVIQLITPNVSFLGHLAGILVGLLPSCGNSITGDKECYRVTVVNGTQLCASAAKCDSFDTCDEHQSCSSRRSVCAIDSCCKEPICIPYLFTKRCRINHWTPESRTPLRAAIIHPHTRWIPKGVTVAGGYGRGGANNQLWGSHGLYVDENKNVYIADFANNRIIEWKHGSKIGQVVAGGWSKRVSRWPRRYGQTGETIVANIACAGLTMDVNGYIYATDTENHQVLRYKIGESVGTVVAGGNGKGSRLDQLDSPRFLFVDRDYSVYVGDRGNQRVMKWPKSAKSGILVAGGQGLGSDLKQLAWANGIVVDQSGTLYVAEEGNHRVTRWAKGATEGIVIAGGIGIGEQANQLNMPCGLSFDKEGNIYVVDYGNYRVQRFDID
ncbi:unnamed protein product [Rotaria magnacalcarata]|uniref:Peptidase S54 rhomboid domain-containing protein n=4 Tax=Rotaria magnacalcarata TaxID=392030 RepID=A0A819TCM5_9BILA|nr:unnamed protein product [Rotaria magnacalcarata]CAF4074739.1 unnamed protein product [Rotaria magnacalcarata]